LGCQGIGSNGRDDDVNLDADEVCGEIGDALVSALGIAILDADVLSLDPSEVTET